MFVLAERELVCGRDVLIVIDGRRLLQAEKAELRRISELHRVRSCFCSEDVAHIEGRPEYKLNLTGVRFRQPFTNYNFYDLDNFTVSFQLDGEAFLLHGCMWDDFRWVTDKAEFREHISIAALKMRRETHNEGS